MPSSQHEDLVEELERRIRARTYASGETAYTLDLRGRKWGDRGQLTIRRRGHPQWPSEGVPVATRAQAEEQLKHYAEWLGKRRSEVNTRRRRVVAWGEAIPAYLDALARKKGRDHNTYAAHRSPLVHHVLPKWKREPLTLTTLQVGEWLDGLKVRKKVNGSVRKVKMAPATKRMIRTAMYAVFRHHFGAHSEPSFKGVRITKEDEHPERVADAEAGVIREPDVKVYDSAVVREILVHAAVNDYLGIRSKPQTWHRAVPNTPEAIAWQIGTLTRIGELMHIRWHGRRGGDVIPMVDLERAGGVIYIPGTKTGNAPRWVVIWNAMVPWVERMQQITLGSTDGMGHVFATPTRPGHTPSASTYAGRIDKAISSAGHKVPDKRTHILRSTGSTFVKTRLDESMLKLFVGHSAAHGGATDRYLDPEQLVLDLPSSVRTYMDGKLPTPESIYEEASERLRRKGHDVDLLGISGNSYL